MHLEDLTQPTIGGMLIGLSASLLLLFKGRIFGVSGILNGVLLAQKKDLAWRIAALAGLLTAGCLYLVMAPEMLVGATHEPILRYVIAGLLVGFGTQLGSGCTSGHGVCGISRLSPRSIVSTLIFMTTGMLMVAVIRSVGGTP